MHHLEEIDLRLPLADYAGVFAPKSAFLLEGASGPSMFGAEPHRTLRAFRSGRVVVTDASGTTQTQTSDPLAVVRALLAEEETTFAKKPLPFLAGAVGYFGYELGQCLERLPCIARPSAGMPDVALAFHRWVIGRDASGNGWLSIVGAEDEIERTRAHVLAALARAEPSAGDHARAGDLVPALSAKAYEDAVREAKRHILTGDAFEICLTNAASGAFDGDPWRLFRALAAANPAPYAALLDLPEGAIVSSSPERFLTLGEDRTAESRPIKGTRPRGATPEEDDALARDLATAPKDRAENAMIVDLVRNDLGRVCTFGSVTVPSLYAVERYATVHQLVSTIRGKLEVGKDAIDLLRACFPPGSMTGAPKIEAMAILERLEPHERGPYAGALGWLGADGTMDLSVVIRTIVIANGRAHVHAGGAVVADSTPEAERLEAETKARALVAALGGGA